MNPSMKRVTAFVLDHYDDGDRCRVWTGHGYEDVSRDDLRYVLALAKEAAELKRRARKATATLRGAAVAHVRCAEALGALTLRLKTNK